MNRHDEPARPIPRESEWRPIKRTSSGNWVSGRLKPARPIRGALIRATQAAQGGATKRKPWKIIRTVRKALGWD